MNNGGYINIQGWFINNLELNGNELLLYAIIFGFSQDRISEYYGSFSYISKALKISTKTAGILLNKLMEKNYIERVSESRYRVTDFSFSKKVAMEETSRGGGRKFHSAMEETSYNNNNLTNKINITSDATLATPSKEIKTSKLTSSKTENQTKILTIFKIFEENEIQIPKLFFKNKTQREASLELFNDKGEKKVDSILKYCQKSIEELEDKDKKYFPNFSNPYNLLKNYESIKIKST